MQLQQPITQAVNFKAMKVACNPTWNGEGLCGLTLPRGF